MTEDVKYIRHDFDGACGKCGALIPAGRAACLVCGAACGEMPYANVFPIPAQEGGQSGAQGDSIPPPARNHRRTPDIWRRWGSGVCAVILAVFVSIAGLGIYRQHFDTSGYRAGESILYESDSGRLMLSHPGLDQPREVIGVNRPQGGYSGGTLSAGATGRWLAYTSVDGGIYVIDLAWSGGDQQIIEAQRLADGAVSPVVFSKNGGYLTWLTAGGELYASDLDDVWKLDTGVLEVTAVGERGVLYTRRGDSDRGADLFLSELARDSGEWRLIDRGVTEVLDWTASFGRIFYTSVKQSSGGEEETVLQMFDHAAGTAMVASGIDKALDASAEKSAAYYLVAREESWTYDMFVDDDLAAVDAKMREPDIRDYPLVMEEYDIQDEDGELSGPVYVDEEIFSGEISEDEELLNAADNEELIEQLNMYREEMEAWESKLARDEQRRRLRNALNASGAESTLYDLYIYQNGQTALLDSYVSDFDAPGSATGAVSAGKNHIAYHWLDVDSLSRMKMSLLWESPEMQSINLAEYFILNTRQELRFSQQGGAPVRLMDNAERIRPECWRVSPAADGVYVKAGKLGGMLYYVPVRNGAAGDAVLVEREAVDAGVAFRDGVIFRAGEDASRVYFAQGREARLLGGLDIRMLGLYDGAGTILYLTDSGSAGTLRMLAREERIIASGVGNCAYYSDELLYISKPNEGSDTVDVYIWQGGRERLIERDARAVISLEPQRTIYKESATGQ